MIVIGSSMLTAELDPDHGSDVLALRSTDPELDLLFTTPWRDRAERLIREGGAATAGSDYGRWLERYRGGWQTLVPNAGPGRVLQEAPQGFHGEVASVPWQVLDRSSDSVALRVELFTAPLRVDRHVTVRGGRLQIEDRISNLGAGPTTFDYVSHPAFGGRFVDDGLLVESAAARFDGETHAEAEPGAAHPNETTFEVPPAPAPASRFGTLSDFDRGEVTLTSLAHDTAVRIEWDSRVLPMAWVWQELNASHGFPWFGRARVLAIEPASTPITKVGGPGLSLPEGGSMQVTVALSVRRAGVRHGDSREGVSE